MVRLPLFEETGSTSRVASIGILNHLVNEGEGVALVNRQDGLLKWLEVIEAIVLDHLDNLGDRLRQLAVGEGEERVSK